jgi:hypothetical protein
MEKLYWKIAAAANTRVGDTVMLLRTPLFISLSTRNFLTLLPQLLSITMWFVSNQTGPLSRLKYPLLALVTFRWWLNVIHCTRFLIVSFFCKCEFFFFQLYNSLWVLICSIIPFHCFLSCVLCFQLLTPIFLRSFLTSSSHLTLGLPFGLVA